MVSALVSMALLSMAVTASPVAAQSQSAVTLSQSGARPQLSLQRMVFHGTTSLAKAAAASSASSKNASAGANAARNPSAARSEIKFNQRGYRAVDVRPGLYRRSFALSSATVPVPSVKGRNVIAPDPGFFGFPGLTHFDERNAGTGIYAGTQFSLEPPDQALCVGNGFVMEAVNDALAVYSSGGAVASAPVPLSQFFGLAPAIVRSPGIRGPFISDPKCYFDKDTQRWFVTELEYDVNPATGAPVGRSANFVAISQTSDPTGNFNVLSFDTSDRDHPGCPCFGDQPLLGADANGFYITTNEFPLVGPGFNGAQVYAFSKIALALGIVPTVVHIDAGSIPTPDPGQLWYSIQPATSPDSNRAHQERNGTEFFLSALQFTGTTDNRIATWALTGTGTLFNPAPKVQLHRVVIRSEAYGQPPNATQRPGPTPLGTSLKEPLEAIQTNDDRMNQVVFSRGRLWSGVNTVLRAGGVTSAGSAYFAVAPSFNGTNLAATVVEQGYVAVGGQNTIFPSIGVNTSGTPVLVCTLVGPSYFPSAVYVPLTRGNESVRLAAAGTAPDDGFTGYVAYGGNGAGRWGDYSAAVADERGSIWLATEYIPNSPRTPLANWGTFVGRVP